MYFRAVFWKIVLLLCFCSAGFCCNSGWFHFQGMCYRVTEFFYNVEEAGRFCQLSLGRLASVNNNETLRFLEAVPTFNKSHRYWIRKSPITNSSTVSTDSEDASEHEQSCPYVFLQKLNFEYCTEMMFFICEIEDQNSSEICPSGFDYYGTHCYRTITNQANYEDASKFCALQPGKLAVLDTESKEWEAKSAVIGKNQTFLIGATKNENGTFIWSNGKEFDPVLHTFLTDANYTCLGIQSESEQPTVIGWVHANCEDKYSFLCETEPLSRTSTTEATTTEAPLICPHGYNWKSHEASGYCYWETTYETQRMNWFQARDFCKLFGGDLASYQSEAQQSLGLGGAYGHYRGLWIGLKRDEFDVFHWMDGTVLNYTNWNWNEPNLKSKSKFCVTHAAGNSKWELDYCGVRRWFICRAPKVRTTFIPATPKNDKIYCDVGGVSVYRNQWYLYEDHCYLIQERAKYTWDTAQLFCQDNGAHLASIHSFEETDFILSSTSPYPDTDFWIGLSSHGLHSSYVWSDNTPLNFFYWFDNMTEEASENLNSCVRFNKRDGSWNTDHCNRLQGIICKRGFNSIYEFTTTEPTTIMPGNCENGWYNLGNKCYGLFGKQWSKRLTWFEAKVECEKAGASLVSIHSQDEQDFLTDIVLEGNTNVWIGLQSKDSGTIFYWSDDSRMDYTNWNENEPDDSSDSPLYQFEGRNNDLCVDMEGNDADIGKWNDFSCTEKRAYICEKTKNPLLTEPYNDPFKCSNISGWNKLGSSCYGLFEQQELSWLDAQKECSKYGANLVTFTNSAVQIFLNRKIKPKNGYFWIGVREKTQDKYEFITGQPMFYSYWTAGQPRAASSLYDNCVATSSNGSWVVKSCGDKLPFICKLRLDESDLEDEIPKENTCINVTGDWVDYGGDNCYLIVSNIRKSWGEAMHYCFKHGGYLASFHSTNDIEEIRKHITNPVSQSLHIGLGKKGDGSYAWVDNSPVDFTAWNEDEPDDSDKECVEMTLTNGKWNDVTCGESFRGFICSASKLQIPGETLTKNYTTDDDIIRQKLTIGGIFGIVICILVVLAIIGVTVYHLRPTKQVQPKLLDSDCKFDNV